MLYIGGFFWTLGYDTVYAHQDKEDDAFVGVKSTALRLGSYTKPALAVFYSITCLCFVAAGIQAGLGIGFYGGLAFVAAQLGWQVMTVNIDDPDSCLKVFRSNRDFGFLFLCAIYFGATS